MAQVDTAEHTIRVGATTNLGTPLLFETRSNTSIEALRGEQLVAMVILKQPAVSARLRITTTNTAGQIEREHAAVHAYTRQYGQVTCSIIAVDYNGYTERFALADTQLLSCKFLKAVMCNCSQKQFMYSKGCLQCHLAQTACHGYCHCLYTTCSLSDIACCSCGRPARLKLRRCFC